MNLKNVPALYSNVPYPIAKDALRVTKEPDDNSWGARPHDKYMPGEGTYHLVFLS